jgi:hypothetical protein
VTEKLHDASDRFAEYLYKLVKGAAEVVNERELALDVKYPDESESNKYRSDELYHNYLMSIGAYEIICRIVMFYNTLVDEVESAGEVIPPGPLN